MPNTRKILDKAIKVIDAAKYEYEGTYLGAKIQITEADKDGTRNVFVDGRSLWQDEGSVGKVLNAVKSMLSQQQAERGKKT